MKKMNDRETALMLVFEMTFHNEPFSDRLEDSLSWSEKNFGKTVLNRVNKVQENLVVIDSLISTCLKNWRIERIPRVTLSILRLAVCEMMFYPKIPVGATINESVNLAKKYATTEDASFINGILGTIARQNSFEKTVGVRKGEEDAKSSGN